MILQKAIDWLSKEIELYQETEDQEQLKPLNRLNSIYNVIKFTQPYIWNSTHALDIGTWFWYWIILLDAFWINTIWCENIPLKYKQSLRLFKNLKWIEDMDFADSPAIINKNLLDINIKNKVDLITSFYTGEYFFWKDYVEKYKEILNPNGKIIFATHISKNLVDQKLQHCEYLFEAFEVQTIDIPNNFEKTAIIASLR